MSQLNQTPLHLQPSQNNQSHHPPTTLGHLLSDNRYTPLRANQAPQSLPNNVQNHAQDNSHNSPSVGSGGRASYPNLHVNPNIFAPENAALHMESNNVHQNGTREQQSHLSHHHQHLQETPHPTLLAVAPEAPLANNHEEHFQLDDEHLQLVNRLTQTDRADHWRITMMMMGSILQRLDNGSHGTARGSPAVAGDAIVSASPHVFSANIKTFIRRRIRELITVGDLDAYSRTQTIGGIPIQNTPLVLLKEHLERQSMHFKLEHLPANWPRNHLASQSVLALMRLLLKHERGNLRNLLLTNVKDFSRRSVNGPVPSLMELILIIDRALGARDELRPIEVVRQAYTTPMKIRIAFLRLEVIHHYLNPDPANNLTQWDLIDRRLEFVRRQNTNYRNAYARVIVNTDRALFGELEFSSIPPEGIRLPTTTDVEKEITRRERDGNNNGGANIQLTEFDGDYAFE